MRKACDIAARTDGYVCQQQQLYLQARTFYQTATQLQLDRAFNISDCLSTTIIKK